MHTPYKGKIQSIKMSPFPLLLIPNSIELTLRPGSFNRDAATSWKSLARRAEGGWDFRSAGSPCHHVVGVHCIFATKTWRKKCVYGWEQAVRDGSMTILLPHQLLSADCQKETSQFKMPSSWLFSSHPYTAYHIEKRWQTANGCSAQEIVNPFIPHCWVFIDF